jgi:oxygen-dependent protoporphyrinogen oxidase
VLAFAERRFGPEAARRIVAPAVIGIYAGDAAALSVQAALPRLAEMERRHGSLLRAALAERRAPGRMLSFPDGLEELPRALAARLGDRRRAGRATAVERAGGAWRVTVDRGPPVEAERVVLATPGAQAAPLLETLAPEAASALRAVPTAPVAVVCLGFRGPDLGMDLDGYGFLAARGEGVRLLGCQYESSIFDGRAPAGAVLLRTILGGAFDPGLLDGTDDALVAQAVADLRKAAGLRRDPDFAAVWRHPAGIPQYDLDQTARIRTVDEAVARLSGMHVIGQAVRGVGINDCIKAAAALAHHLAA